MKRLSGKTAFITGIASGQGRAAAQLFAAEGARIIGCDLNGEGAEETCRLVRAAGGVMDVWQPVDLGSSDEARRWIEQGMAASGRIDILYNNAAAVRFGFIANMAPQDWTFTLRNELDLLFHVTQAAWSHLIASGGGSIINTSSGSALRGNAKLGAVAHAAAKGAVLALTQQIAAEGATHGIRCNAISPGAIETPASADVFARLGDSLRASIPLGRWGQPEDVAWCALYLASDEARWVTGANFVIDGGVNAVR